MVSILFSICSNLNNGDCIPRRLIAFLSFPLYSAATPTTQVTPQVTPFTPRSLEEWKYVQKHGDSGYGQDGNINAQELRWLRFLITDVEGCDQEGNPWMGTPGGRRSSTLKGGLGGLGQGGEGDGEDADTSAMSPLKWYDDQHTPARTTLHSHASNQHTNINSSSNSSNRRRPRSANDGIHYHFSVGTAAVIATTAQQYQGSATADSAAATTATRQPESDSHHQQNRRQKQQPQKQPSPPRQQQQQQQQQQQKLSTSASASGLNSVGKPKPVPHTPWSPTATAARGGEGSGATGEVHFEPDGEITLTDNGLAKLVAKIRKQQLNWGDASLKWTPDRLAGDTRNPPALPTPPTNRPLPPHPPSPPHTPTLAFPSHPTLLSANK